MQGGVNVKKDESGNKISKQMNTLALLISKWFSQWAISKRLWILQHIFLIAILPQSRSPFFCGNPSLIYLCTNRPFGFSAHASLFLGCLFSFFVLFFFAYCFTARLKLELCSKWMKFFYFPKEEKLFSSSTCIWSKWTFEVRNIGQVRVYRRRG